MNVLVVDDSLSMRLMITAIARKVDPDCAVDHFESAEAAMESIDSKTHDYYCIDHTLPGMNGMDLIKHIKEKHPGAKISLVTANKQDAIVKRTAEAGVGMIIKPDLEGPLTEFFRS